MDKEYGTAFKRLVNERNELRKYIIDVCELLDINSNQSVLRANCVEFYAVLSSTAKNRIRKYKQAFDEIENIADDYNRVEKTSQYYRDGFDQIQNIINTAKDN